MDARLLTEAAYECMSPDQMNAFEALFADADLARRYANCVRKRIAPEASREQQPAAWISYDTVMHKERIDRMPITSLQPGVYKHTPLYAAPVAPQAAGDAAQAPVAWQYRERNDSDEEWSIWRNCHAETMKRHKGEPNVQFRPLYAAPVPPAAVAPINLEGLRKKLLTPRNILRDDEGWLTHTDFPVCDEGTRADKFLEAFGIETRFVSMENDLPDLHERWCDEGLTDCSSWTPTPPAGDGWLLLEIYDTEDGPYAMFGRDKYEAENALKRKRTRELSARVQQRQATQGDTQ